MARLVPAAALFATLAAGPALAQAVDGAQVFANQCQGCHVGPSTPLAPSLAGVAGAKIASRSDFEYSAALKAKADVWSDANLDTFLKGPQDFAPGTAMFVAPQSDENRKALIEYLKTLKPDAPDAPAAPAAAKPDAQKPLS
ncbi:MAG: c-type cytochrome [Phenylobacterium sp.]